MKKIALYTILVTASCTMFSTAQAAVLTNITSVGVEVSEIDLSAEGTSNWAAWNVRVDDTETTIAATYEKAVGVGTISDIGVSALGGGSAVRGSDSFSNYESDFTWTPADASGGVAAPGTGIMSGIFNSSLQTVGNGVQFTLTDLPALVGGQTYEVNVYTSAFRSRGQLSVNMNGGTALTQLGPVHDTGKETDLFTLGYNPDLLTDVLTISFGIHSNTQANSDHTVIQAVAINVVPEPSSLFLVAGGIMAMMLTGFYRRRK